MTTDNFLLKFNNNAILDVTTEEHQLQDEFAVTDTTITYNVSYLDGGIKIDGNGYDNITWPNLTLIRGNEYKFIFSDNLSIIDIRDLSGTPINETTHLSWMLPFELTPTSETPDELKYVAWYGDHAIHGLIHVRNATKITGRVIGYGYLGNSTIRMNEDTDVKSYGNGTFAQYIPTGKPPVLSSNLKSFYGTDASINDDCSFLNETPAGSLMLNSFTTLFSRVLEKMEDKNIHLVNELITKYFGLSDTYNILSDDPLERFMFTSGTYEDCASLMVFSLYLEYFTAVVGTTKTTSVLNKIALEVLSRSKTFDYYDIDSIANESGAPATFSEMLSVATIKIFEFGKLDTKEVIFSHAYAMIRLVREMSFGDEVRLGEFYANYETNFKLALSRVLPPQTPVAVVLRVVDGCTVAPIGEVAVRVVDGELLQRVFGEVREMTYELFSELVGRVVRVGVPADSFCYEIVRGLYHNDGSIPELEYELLSAYELGETCCADEELGRPIATVQYEEVEFAESKIGSFKLIEGGSEAVMLSRTITNKTNPIESLGNNQYRMYINKIVSSGFVQGSSPAYIGMPREFAMNIDYRGIRLGYNSGEVVRSVTMVRYDWIKLRVVTTWMESDGVLNMVSDREHGVNAGDQIAIRSSSKSGLINGTFKVLSTTEATMSLEYNIPDERTPEDMVGITATFESLYGSKVYCNTTDYEVDDMVAFDFASESGKIYRVHEVSSDELGTYIVVIGFVSRYIKKVAKSHSQVSGGDKVEFNYESHLNYYKIAGMNAQTDSLWLTYSPDLHAGGRAGNTLSFVEFFHKNMDIYS